MPNSQHISKSDISISSATYPTTILTQPPWQDFFSRNGYINLSAHLFVKVYNDIEETKHIWELFSPDKSAFDLWDVRLAFWDGYHFQPYVITLQKNTKHKDEIVAALPLWFTSETENEIPDSPPDRYVWFGSNWPEDNVLFVKEMEYAPLLFSIAPKPLELACFKPLSDYNFLLTFPGFSREEDKKYFLDLSQIHTLDDFLNRLKKKKRYNLKRDRKHMLALTPVTRIDCYSDVEEMFKLNIMRFREKYPDNPSEYSAFEDERRCNVYRSLISRAGKYQARLITTVIGDKIEAVEFGLVYNKTYYAFNAGVDVSAYSGLGVFSNLAVVEDAIKLGCTKIDFLEGDNNWKESWNLDFVYQYQFKK